MSTYSWAFRTAFRRKAFGWNGTRKAVERMDEAIGEIERKARTDPAVAGEGAVLLLEKRSPALCDIDSSSGALGNATGGVVLIDAVVHVGRQSTLCRHSPS